MHEARSYQVCNSDMSMSRYSYKIVRKAEHLGCISSDIVYGVGGSNNYSRSRSRSV